MTGAQGEKVQGKKVQGVVGDDRCAACRVKSAGQRCAGSARR